MGYAIVQQFYDAANDKKAAIKQLIELDYQDDNAIVTFVDQTAYFSTPIEQLQQQYEKKHPTVIAIQEFKNGDQGVNSGISTITVEFSQPMNTQSRGFEFGPLGQGHVLSVKNFIGYSEDGKSVSWEVELLANKQYQVMLSESFMDTQGSPLKPYLIDIKTKEQ